eukprot:CAMPEP_0171009912 /NCGR_PEP_ID=MMETSP0736-20130129/21646_1 /TAXON_ID=186038 /ORGANISM="Fragilariopsis kerguelensis, Strain L26-C5" /LENGTH=47 /DNA_ID= /DNA_START= /DNA_END= /DNA_ORIENTATION=
MPKSCTIGRGGGILCIGDGGGGTHDDPLDISPGQFWPCFEHQGDHSW